MDLSNNPATSKPTGGPTSSMPGASVAVCGVEAAGKSVFLTCLFRSLARAVSPDLTVTFDRDFGGASHFEVVERAIVAKGQIPSTLASKIEAARLLIQLRGEPLPMSPDGRLQLDLRDFAGGHFRAFADPKAALADESDEEANAAYREVDQILERADAVVLLISSVDLDQAMEAGTEDPFSISVDYMITHCREKRRPIALLASQADRAPALTAQRFHALPSVLDFERIFTSDLAEYLNGGRPFGIARQISCYTADGGGIPIKVSADGRIWHEEPAQIVLDLLRAVVPAIRLRQRAALEEQERKAAALERQLAVAAAQQVAEAAHSRRRAWINGAIIFALLGASGLLFAAYHENRQVQERVRVIRAYTAEVQSGDFRRLATQELPPLLEAVGGEPAGEKPDAVGTAMQTLSEAIVAAARSTLHRAEVTAEHQLDLERLVGVSGTPVEPAPETWRTQIVPRLSTRSEILSDWLHGSSNSLETQLVRLSQVAEAARGAGDPELARAFESQAVELRQALFRAWSSEIEGASGDSIGRLEKIRSLIARAMTDPDSSHRLESLSFLADRVGWALLDRSETNVLAEALKEMEPALAPVVSTGLRFEIAASALAACDSADACRQHSQACIAVLRDLRSRAETRRSLVESALLDLTRPLSSADRRVIWSALLGGLENSYLFLAEPGSWPSGLQSFPTRARQVLVDMAGEPVLAQGQLIERLASTPIYEAEIRYLRETAELSWAHYRLIEVLHRALTSTSSTAALSTASDVRGVREGLEDEYEEYAAGPTHWDAPLNPTKLLHDGLTTLLEELSRSSGSLGDSLRSKLRGRLRALCQGLENEPESCSLYE